MKLISIRLIVFVACLVGLALSVSATQVIFKSVEQLGEDSSAVVMGTVVNVRSFWNDTRSKIFTSTVIAVEESYKGRPGGSVEVLQLGGTVDNVQVTAHGALRWAEGEEVVLFLEPATEGRFQVAGFSQGKFKVERDPVTGRAFIHRPAQEGVELVGDDGHQHNQHTSISREPLDQFLANALGADFAPSNR